MMAAMPKPSTRPSWISSSVELAITSGVVLKREAHGPKLLLQSATTAPTLRPSRSATTSMRRETASR